MFGFGALHFASIMGHDHVVHFLLTKGVDISAASPYSGFTALHCAAIAGQTSVVKKLMTEVKDANMPSKNGDNALHFAAKYGHSRTVDCLLGYDSIHKNAKGHRDRTALHFASIEDHLGVVKTLLRHEADIEALSDDRCSPLMFAVYEENMQIIENLINNGACINPTNLAFPPLVGAAVQGRTSIIKFLINKGADINHTGRFGFSILHLLAWFGSTDVLKFVIQEYKCMIQFNIQAFRGVADDDKIRAFHYISGWCKQTAGRDINLEDYDSGTPLHVAADLGHIEIMKVLIENGTDLNLRNRNGELAKDVAMKRGHMNTLSLFK